MQLELSICLFYVFLATPFSVHAVTSPLLMLVSLCTLYEYGPTGPAAVRHRIYPDSLYCM